MELFTQSEFIKYEWKRNETKLNKIKNKLKNYSWIIWTIPFYLITSYYNGIKSGLIIFGLLISGVLLGAIILLTIDGVCVQAY